MKKSFIILCILALCITMYSLSQAYAAINALPITSNNTKQPTPTTNTYSSPTSTPIRPCGDPINDPRPK
jgi:hypothetical protein